MSAQRWKLKPQLVPLMWALGILSFDYMLAFLAVTFALGVSVSVGSLAIEEAELRRYPKSSDLAALALAAIVEKFGYRQLNSLWRLRGLWEWARGVKSWGEMSRRGFQTVPA